MIVVWVGSSCGPCFALKRALRAADVPFEERDASTLPEGVLEAWRAKGWSTPVVEHAGETFSGFIPAKVQSLIDMWR